MAAKRKIDYDRIEPDWRAGIKSVYQLAEEYERHTGVSVTHGAINKHFKARGIPRDLTARIKAKAEAKVSAAMVSGKVSADTIIEANAENIAAIDLSHRADVKRARDMVTALMDELQCQIVDKELYENIGEMMRSEDKYGNDKLNDLYNKIISFNGRTDNIKKLSETLRFLVELERKIVKLDDPTAVGTQGDVNLVIRPI